MGERSDTGNQINTNHWNNMPMEFLEDTPSRRDGITKEAERSYRNKSTWFIEALGKELKW